MSTEDISQQTVSADLHAENLPSSNIDNGEVQPSTTRVRQQTERYTQWRMETQHVRFRQAVSSWRKHATQVGELLADSIDIGQLRSSRDVLKNKMADIAKCYDDLMEDSEISAKYDSVEQDNYRLCKDISDQIRNLENEQREIISQASVKTVSSRNSRRTQAEAAADAAAMRVKLKFIDIEAAQRIELEQKRIQLEKTQALRDYNIAEAKLDAIVHAESNDFRSNPDLDLPTVEKGQYVADFIQVHTERPVITDQNHSQPSAKKHLNVTAPVFSPSVNKSTPIDAHATNEVGDQRHTSQRQDVNLPINDCYQNIAQNIESGGQLTDNYDIGQVLKSLTDQATLSRLPIPEPGVFSGDPIQYPSWRCSFQTLVANKGIPRNERIYYLKKYLGGNAKECVDGFLMLTTDEAYEEAMSLLQERYGDPFAVADGFRKKLDSWPKIPPRDGNALRKFSDFLKQCEIAMRSIRSLKVLDDDQENRKMLMKLPDWLTLRWGRIVSEWRERRLEFPPFSEFVSFVAKEAKIACDPVASLQSLKSNTKPGDVNNPTTTLYSDKRRSAGRSYATETKASPSHVSSGEVKRKSCAFCKKTHNIDDCYSFLAKTLQERKDFARVNGLCFGCLVHGHCSRDCKQKLTCKTCDKPHPTSLHGDVRKPAKIAPSEEGSPKSAVSHAGFSNHMNSELTCKCSMIVPVYLSHSDRPDDERLVYALLDTQSDTTFVLEKTCDDLGIHGRNVDLLLSTMTSENKVVKSRKFEGLLVRGFDSQLKIPLPATYAQEVMPSNRAHIPTPEIAKNWPHLEKIADKLMPLSDAPVGLLIGYNCSRALAPRDVIAPAGDEPYAQRTDLGWGIVGVVHLDHENNDPIGISHHIVTHDVSTKDNLLSAHSRIALQTRMKEVITPLEVAHMMEADFSELRSDGQGPSFEDLRFLKIMKEGIHRTDDQHYKMPLPLKDPSHKLSNNRHLAMRRLRQLESKFSRDPTYQHDYQTFMDKMIKDGFAELIPESELKAVDGEVWYIPHHGVYHPKKPTKIRVVFDCSSKCHGESLNNNLLQGPDLMNKMLGVLCRFRQEQVAFTCDVEQMFFQFRDDESLRTLLCEAAAIVNSRPLTTDNLNDATSPEPLTANHLLTMKSMVLLPPPGAFVREDIYSRKRWRRVQHLANEFWFRWKREYLQNIQQRQKWTKTRRDLQIGDIVIIKDESLPRNQWLLARVAETYPGDDDHVRSAKLCIADPSRDNRGKRVKSPTYLSRPIQKLVLLLENE